MLTVKIENVHNIICVKFLKKNPVKKQTIFLQVELHLSVPTVCTCSVAAVVAFFLKIFFRQQQQIPAGMPSSKSRAMSGFPPENSWWSAVEETGTQNYIYAGGLKAMRGE